MSGQIYNNGWTNEPFTVRNNPPEFVIDGFEFVCWNTKKDGSGTKYYPGDKFTIQTNTTLYAQWKQIYKFMRLIEIGDVDVQSNIATEFNIRSGFRTPMFFNWTPSFNFELILKIKTDIDVTEKQVLYRMSDTYKCNLCIYNSKLYIDYNNATSSQSIHANTNYFIKIHKNGTNINVYISDDGITYQNAITTQLNITTINQYLYIGHSYEEMEEYQYYKTVQKTVLDGTKLIWETKSGCAYAPSKYTYNDRLKHAKKINKGEYSSTNTNGYKEGDSNSCGKWVKQNNYTTKPVQELTNGMRPITAASFLGEIDFNQSYLTIENIKYKLKV